MRGYQAIPGVSTDALENEVESISSSASMVHDNEDGLLLVSSVATGESSCRSSNAILSSSLWWRSSSSWPMANKNFARIALGMLLGCTISKLVPLTWVDFQPTSEISSFTSSSMHPNDNLGLINGKSFSDSLPFEEISPKNAHHVQQQQPATTTTTYDMNLLSASIIGSSNMAVAPPPPSSSSINSPHLLYHASLSSFGLLYDLSQSSNNYISEFALDYFLINSGGFDAQINQAYCGPATVATMLNSLKYARRFRESNNNDGGLINGGWSFDLPIDPRYNPYPYATQHDVLSGECVRTTVIKHNANDSTAEDNGIFQPPYGLNLEQSAKLLACHTSTQSSSTTNSDEWSISIQHVDPQSLALSRMRYELKSALIDPYARVMINYDRKGLGQVGGGHFSPLGAYHEKTDSFLIMDVAKYKYPPVWVGAATLYAAMATPDKCGSWDYPNGQERLVLTSDSDSNSNNGTATEENHLFNPITPEEYENSLKILNCKERMRGYIILKKKVG